MASIAQNQDTRETPGNANVGTFLSISPIIDSVVELSVAVARVVVVVA